MKQLLFLVLACCFCRTCALGQAKEAINNKADTMQKYVPDQQLSPAVTVRRIVIEGNEVTRRAILLREMSVHEGDSLVTDSIPRLLNQNKLRLINLSLFNEIEMNIDKVNQNEIDWHIKVKERWYILPKINIELADRNFNTWWVEQNHDPSRINVGLTIYDYNFRGNLEYLSATVQLGYTRLLALNYQIPYIDKRQRWGIGLGASTAMSRQTYYTTDSNKLQYVNSSNNDDILRQTEANIHFVYRPAYATKHRFMITYKDYKIGDTIIQLNPNYYEDHSNKARLIEFLYRLELNHVDNWNYPLYGFKFVGYAVSRIGLEGLSAQHYLNVETGVFGSPLPKWYLAAIFRGRLMFPQKQPYYFTGGLGTKTDYVRGYEYYVIDGSHYGVLRLDLKREIFNKTYNIPVKYFTAIPLRIYPKLFVDAGYIKNSNTGTDNFLAANMMYSIGAGLDIVTLYDLKIRFEFAYNHLAQNGLYLHFNSE